MKNMKCMVCDAETRFKMKLGEIEASFCYEHLTENISQKGRILLKCRCYSEPTKESGHVLWLHI